MATLNSKISKAIFAVVASFVVNLAWQNVWRITSRYTKPNCAQLFNTRSTNGTFYFYSSLYCC